MAGLFLSDSCFVIMLKEESQEESPAGLQALRQKVSELNTSNEKLSAGYDWLKWSHRNLMTLAAIVLSVVGVGFAVLFFAIRDTKQDIQRIDSRIDRIDSRIDKLDSRIDKLESRIDRIDIDKIDSKLDLLIQSLEIRKQ